MDRYRRSKISNLSYEIPKCVYVYFQIFIKYRDCVSLSDKQIVCKTPSLDITEMTHAQIETRGAIVLDGVKQTFVLHYFMDPEIGPADAVNSSTILDVVNGHLFIEVCNLKNSFTSNSLFY